MGPYLEKISVLIRRATREVAQSHSPSSPHSLPHERTVRRQTFASQEESPHQIPTTLDLDLGLSNHQSCEKINRIVEATQPVVSALVAQAN